jgi:drug/metabolite transporter (DMT)-like permease
MTKATATLTGFVAVLLWSLLALLTVRTAPVPPFLLNALTFAIGGTVGLVWVALTGGMGQLARVPLKIYLFGTAGLFGYHALYFSALRMAPAAEAGLIAYLWPLLIVLFSGLLPGERLLPGHFVGGLIAFAGAALIVTAGGTGFAVANLPGYGLAFLCALTWAVYSVVSRRFGAVPTASVTVFCMATAALSLIVHVAVEESVWPAGPAGWLAVAGLGLGPVGLAFFVWDVGVKRGDIQLLGVASYAAPLLSTLALVLGGVATLSWTLGLAAVLIAGGAALAATASARHPNLSGSKDA